MDDEAKLKARALKFGLNHPSLEKEKAKQRALKFGLPHPDIEQEKRTRRQQRFSHDPQVNVTPEVLKKRAERFGVTNGRTQFPDTIL
ncbi:putative carrier domain protein [Gregarina niphandrodes]|uniref:Carrier domain protein n=1 Tax=Gregarina niphandrodes TaxID=110365 RepID=A0A023B0W1_GRENI|nr:putative carrier domain protein [Gregarina niphandrodes]EZG46101.1 putative carrier domain protein [Gregarina niphandrodes]|eukprot:XP_011132357.1 putative carrier domain protein [Gregarina niphandrodes]